MNDKEFFQLIYDGPALKSNEMDARELAPALIAVGDLLEETNLQLYGKESKIIVNVKGTFKSGCFRIDFATQQSFINSLTDMFASKEMTATVNVLFLLGINSPVKAITRIGDGTRYAISSLFQLIMWLKKRTIKRINKIGTNKMAIEVDDEVAEVDEQVVGLFSNLKIRQCFELIIFRFLSKEGIENFSFKYKDRVSSVTKEQKEYFIAPPAADKLIEDKTETTTLQAITITFIEDNKWRFSDGTNQFFAVVKDEDFIQKVQKNLVSFAKDDILKVELRKIVWMTEKGLKSDFEVLKVIHYQSVGKQINLPFVDDESNSIKQ